MNDTIRVGFVGAGVIARAHALSLSALASSGVVDAEIVSVHDQDIARRDRFVENYGAQPAEDADEVARRSDVVYVCTSTAGHLAAVRAAAGAGRPIFCEKPLGRDLQESLHVAEAVASAGVAVQVGLVMRSAPVFRRLAELTRTGELGRPMAAIVRDDQYFPITGHYGSTWRGDVNLAGAGALLEHSIHDVDIIRACFGSVESVSAVTANFAGHKGIEDSVTVLLQMSSGLAVTLVSVWHDIRSRPSTRRVEVFFERGYVSFEDDFTGPLTVQTSDGVEVRECPPPRWVLEAPLPDTRGGFGVMLYVEENREFLDAVRKGIAPSPGMDEAVAAHRVVDGCYRSAAAGGTPVAGPW